MLVQIETYFVLNGLLNGVEGEFATTCGFGEQQTDGWYWLKDGMDDGKGPYKSKDEAVKAARDEPSKYTLVHKTKTWRPYEESDEGSENNTIIVKELDKNHFTLECGEYYSNYGVCKLEITQPLNRALDTFAAVLFADSMLEDKNCSDNQSRNRA